MDTRSRQADGGNRRLLVLLAALAVAIVATAGFLLSQLGEPETEIAPGEAAPAAATTDEPEVGPMSLEVDPATAPAVDTVRGHDGSSRPVGRVADADGIPMDVVLDELVVSYDESSDLDGYLAAVGGEVVDAFDDAPAGEPRDALVRIDPTVISADAAEAAAALNRREPDLAGGWTVSHDAVVSLLWASAVSADYGISAFPHGLYDDAGIRQGNTSEANGTYGPDAFQWPYIASGTAQDIGVDVAWRLLADHDALDRFVKIMVVDQGFKQNEDFPEARWMYRGDWDTPGWGDGSFHGTHVVLAGMGRVDNGKHGAGPAGPVAGLLAVEGASTNWTSIRALRRLVAETDPAIVTMSFGQQVTHARLAQQDFFERQFRRIKQDYGALPFAAAGNDDMNIDRKNCGGCIERVLYLPCEAKHVACVGGMGEDTTARAVGGCDPDDAPGSNYGTRTGGRSVEIWGPYFTVTSGGGRACGTSMATPFVAGVAALVKAADPSLGPDGIWNIMKETAHEGGIGSEVTGHQRRVNAAAAVARALGVQVTAPTIDIDTPAPGTEIAYGEWVDFDATATDYRGRPLPVRWSSSIDGELSGPTKLGIGTDKLSPGEHTINATTSDALGSSAGTGINITVLDPTPEVRILSPENGTTVAVNQDLLLVGWTRDTLGYALPENDVRWVVRLPNMGVHKASATGTMTTIPAGTLAPGLYDVFLSGTVAGHKATDRITITVVVPQPGMEPPVIVKPVTGSELGANTSGIASVNLVGYAEDSQGDKVSGAKLRWTALSDKGTEVVLCSGTDTPGGAVDPGDDDDGGGGGIGGLKAKTVCGDVDVELELEGVSSTWTITLEVYDGGTLRGSSQTAVTVRLAVG